MGQQWTGENSAALTTEAQSSATGATGMPSSAVVHIVAADDDQQAELLCYLWGESSDVRTVQNLGHPQESPWVVLVGHASTQRGMSIMRLVQRLRLRTELHIAGIIVTEEDSTPAATTVAQLGNTLSVPVCGVPAVDSDMEPWDFRHVSHASDQRSRDLHAAFCTIMDYIVEGRESAARISSSSDSGAVEGA